jgi:galactoside O-acetyltransferase
MHVGISFYSEKELKQFKFRSIGKNVLIKKNVGLYFIENISIGNNVRIDDNVIIVASNSNSPVKIGNYVHIASNCYLAGSDGIEIMDFATLAPGVLIFSGSDDYSGKKLTNPTVSKPYIGGKFGKVTLGKHVIIGAGSVILPDVNIKQGSSVGALSLVNKDLEEWGVYFGIPVKKIKNRHKDILELEKKFFTENDQQFCVCILAAGRGTRMGEFTKYFNKALLPINKKSAICHVIDSYQKNARIVVALGYLGDMLRLYLENAYPDRDIVFVSVDNYEGQGSGPGYSLLACRKYLNTPFILANVDALTVSDIPPPNQNWLGISPVDDTSRFCSVRLGNSREILALDDKVKTKNEYAFTGIAGINDYQIFLDGLEKNKLEINSEKQVSGGFEALINHGLKAHILEWYDVGTQEAYEITRKKYEN